MGRMELDNVKLWYIEIIQTFEIVLIIADTKWIYATVSRFWIECQTKGPKNADLRK